MPSAFDVDGEIVERKGRSTGRRAQKRPRLTCPSWQEPTPNVCLPNVSAMSKTLVKEPALHHGVAMKWYFQGCRASRQIHH